MDINLLPFAVAWAVLALVVVALIVYRKSLARGEDDTLHVLDGEVAMPARQQALAQKLESVDRWGKILTVLAIVYGLAVGAAYVYQGWVAASNLR